MFFPTLSTAILLITAYTTLASAFNSHGVECTDKSLCQTRQSCTDRDALFRSGHLCHSFPWYNGGAPFIESLHWDSEIETYECQTTRGHACVDWTTREEGVDEFEVGFGSCTTFDEEKEYCKEWRVDQEEVDLCTGGEWESGTVRTLIDRSQVKRQCCKNVCSDDGCHVVCRNREIEREFAVCQCLEENTPFTTDGKTFCLKWHCVERDNNGFKAAEQEDYVCTMPHPSQRYCQEWSGSADSTEEFEVSQCSCNHFANGTFCESWTCEEDGVDYHKPNLGYIAFAVLFGLFVHCLVVGAFLCLLHEGEFSRNCSLVCMIPTGVLVFASTVLLPSVLRGGVVVLLVAVSWEVIVLVCTVLLLIKKGLLNK